MDPYLEDPVFWPGCHTTLLTAVRAALTPQLPPGYFAELEQHVWFYTEDADNGHKIRKPDVAIANGGAGPGAKKQPRAASAGATRPSSQAAFATPPTLIVTLPEIVREVGQHTVRIRDARNRRRSVSNDDVGALHST